MHVLILPSSYPRFYNSISGVFFRDQAVALKRLGVTVGVIDPSARSIKTIRSGRLSATRFQISTQMDEGIPIVRSNDWSLPYATRLNANRLIARAHQLYRRYAQSYGTPDVIHAHTILWAGVAARALSERVGVPFVVTEHSGGYVLTPVRRWQEPFIAETIRDADAVLAVSRELAGRLTPYSAGREVEVMPNLVDTAFFKPPARRSRGGPFVFSSVGSLVFDKGFDVLLRAFAQAFPNDERVRLVIAGEGEDSRQFFDLANELGVAPRIQWLGALSRAEVRDCLQQSDAFVLPTRYETFGVVLIEAMATGLPVITTRCGGPEEFVTEENGYLVPIDDVAATAGAMMDLYERRDAWDERRADIRASTAEKFSQEVVGERLLGIYEGVRQEVGSSSAPSSRGI